MSRCLLEFMWLKYSSWVSLRSGTQPLDPLQFFLALKFDVAKWILLPHPILHIFQGHLSLARKTWRGDKKGKVQAWIASSPLKFQTHLIPEIISGIFLAFHQEYLFRFYCWKTEEPFLFSLFSFSPFTLSWRYLTFSPFLSCSHPELKTVFQGHPS